jgi:hypothetical protein
MKREEFDNISVESIQVVDNDGEITLFILCSTKEQERLLNRILHLHTCIIKVDEENIVWIVFKSHNYKIKLMQDEHIEYFFGFEWIKNNQLNYINTAYRDELQQLHLNKSDRMAVTYQ